MKRITFNQAIDWAQEALKYFSLIVATVCIIALITSDTWIGAGTMSALVHDDVVAWGISMATSGITMALIIIPIYGVMKKWKWYAILGSTLIAAIPYVFDAYFDMRYADILMYGSIQSIKTLTETDAATLGWFRGLMLLLTTTGDPLGSMLILGMAFLRDILGYKSSRPAAPASVTPQVAEDQTGVPNGFVRVVMPGGASKIFRRGS